MQFNSDCDSTLVFVYDRSCGLPNGAWCLVNSYHFQYDKNGTLERKVELNHYDPSDPELTDTNAVELWKIDARNRVTEYNFYAYELGNRYSARKTLNTYSNDHLMKEEKYLAYQKKLFLADVFQFTYDSNGIQEKLHTSYTYKGELFNKIKFEYIYDSKGRQMIFKFHNYDKTSKSFGLKWEDHSVYLPDSTNMKFISVNIDSLGQPKDSLEYAQRKFDKGRLIYEFKKQGNPGGPLSTYETNIVYNAWGIDSSIVRSNWNADSGNYQGTWVYKYYYENGRVISRTETYHHYSRLITNRTQFYPTCTRSVGFQELKSTSIKITAFPNPATSLIQIDSDASISGFRLYSSTGNLVLQEKAPNLPVQIDVSALENGFYYLISTVNSTQISTPLVVSH